ncbi:MAG: SAM-dependent methyltransferase [Elusimicrobiales bacterium]|nr:SAM-dependent methyltransferase [Elusimicrobiales bacterium]
MKKLVIVSSGIVKGDLTINTIEYANSADIVLNYSTEGEEYLKKYIKKEIININEKISNIELEENKLEFLYSFINKVFKKFSNICLITAGNPLFFNVFITKLFLLFKRDKINIEIKPGISSIDHVINTIIKTINPKMQLYSIFSSPYFLLSTPRDIFEKDTIIINFHSIKYNNSIEEKRILKILSSMKYRKIYLIKINYLNSKETIKKYLLPQDIKKFIKSLDNETTVYLQAEK